MTEELRTADALAELARGRAAPRLSDDDARAMIARAVAESEPRGDDAHGGDGDAARDLVVPTRRWARPLAIGLAAASVLIAAVAGLAIGRSTSAPAATATEEEPTRFDLPTGDVIALRPGTRFSIERVGDARAIRLERGAGAFDVPPLGRGESFEVTTPHLTARVVGTVFTVETHADRSVVRVYEGRVTVEHGGASETVGAGRSVAVGPGVARSPDPLAAIARAAARRRSAADERRRAAGERRRAAGRRVARRAASDPSEAPGEPSPVAPASVDTERAAAREATRSSASARPPAATGALDDPARTPQDALRWIASGDAARARARARAHSGPEWRLVEGDALRASDRHREAVDAYERAAASAAHRVQAGYLIAVTQAQHLSDPDAALDALSGHGCHAAGSPLAERALVLRVRLLRQLGRQDQAAATARDYLERFPDGPRREAMTALATPDE